MYCVFDMRPYLDLAVPLALQFTTDVSLKTTVDGALQPFNPFTRSVLAELCYLIMDDSFSRRLLWAQTSHRYMERMYDYFGSAKGLTDLSSDFRTAVLEEYIHALEQTLRSFVPESTWTFWTITQRGEDIIILSGEDFRIMDWNRRVLEGQIPRPAKYMAASEPISCSSGMHTEYEQVHLELQRKSTPQDGKSERFKDVVMARLSRGNWIHGVSKRGS